LQTTLSDIQEKIVVELRKTLFLPLDDLLIVTREFINPAATRSGLHRTLKRYGVSNLHEMKKALEESSGEKTPKKSFKDYAPGFVHMDIKYLPQMNDETSRKYLFVAIDRASRWVHMEIFPDKSADSAKQFLEHVVAKAPFVITKLLTDNGKEFTDRFIPNGERARSSLAVQCTGQFSARCHGVVHRAILADVFVHEFQLALVFIAVDDDLVSDVHHLRWRILAHAVHLDCDTAVIEMDHRRDALHVFQNAGSHSGQQQLGGV